MKRYIYAMAIPRKNALEKLSSYSDVLERHVIECVVYKNSLGCMNHWIGEIASWLNSANRVNCKVALKEEDYLESLFGAFGDERSDAELDVEVYQRSDLRKNSYPDFDITDKLIDEVFNTFDKLIYHSIPLLTSNSVFSIPQWVELLNKEVFTF